MNRRTLLRNASLASLASLFPFPTTERTANAAALIKKSMLLPDGSCILIPNEVVGPYPWPSGNGSVLTTDQTFYRQDITEGLPGLPLMVNLTVVDINDNCAPVTNAAVVIWHCDASGNYSEYGNSVGKSFLRGVQMTDANGLATFKTIYPGWYSGRTTHIHFQVFLSSHLAATSQMAFPEEINSQVYDVAPYATRGQKDTSNNQDGIFSDTTNTQYEIPIMTGNTTAGYTAHLTVGVPVPTSGVITLEPETGGQFTLAQNVPNPISKTATVVPFMLKAAADVTLDVFDVNGKLLFNAFDGHLDTGAHRLEITQAKTLTSGSYLYRLSVTNSAGTFAQCKIMTVL